MADLNMALAGNLAAAREFLAITDQLGSVWTTPRAPGKWSPAELTEHIALTHDESLKVIKGELIGLPRIPAPLRPLLRRFVFRRVIETGSFGKPMKTFRPFEPLNPPGTPARGRERLLASVSTFESNIRSLTPLGDYSFVHPAFGKLHIADYVRFQEVHTRHHMKQLPTIPARQVS